ncbi:MAG: threonine ammonia-lyase [Mucispirillum sp.]|nr:threonine ammonia-lyase [Mucispirillum sp.]
METNLKDDILKARDAIAPYVKNVPLYHSSSFSEYYGADIYFKLENLQRTGSFKVRGALNAMLKNKELCKNGVIAASAGNHAQGVAFSAKMLGIPAAIVMPVHTPLVKINNTKSYGAEVILHGETYDDAATMAEITARDRNLYLIHPFNNTDIIAGQGTIAAEILEDISDADNIIVPVGGGGLASGIAAYIKESGSGAKVIGVQSEAVSGMATSIRKRRLVRVTGASIIAEGISVKAAGDITFDICSRYLDDIVTVSENMIAAAILEYMEKAKLVTEGAGASPLAAIILRIIDYKNKKNVLIVSGGNIDINMISRIISKGMSTSGRFLEINLILKDTPGALSDVTKLLAYEGANILDIRHDRFGAGLPIGYSRVNLELETKSMEHVEQIVIALKTAGYDVNVC